MENTKTFCEWYKEENNIEYNKMKDNIIGEFNDKLNLIKNGRSYGELFTNIFHDSYKNLFSNKKYTNNEYKIFCQKNNIHTYEWYNNKFESYDYVVNGNYRNFLEIERNLKNGFLGCYSDTPIKLAVKSNTEKPYTMIEYLYKNKYSNMRYSGLVGLLKIICELGNAEQFEYFLEKYKNKIIKEKKIPNVNILDLNESNKWFYQLNEIVDNDDFHFMFKNTIYYKNIEMIMYFIENENLFKLIKLEELKNNKYLMGKLREIKIKFIKDKIFGQ